MRNTGETDVYGLTYPAVIASASGVTTHNYTTEDNFTISVKDTGAEKVEIAVYAPDDFALCEERKDVAKEDVHELVIDLFIDYRL